MKTTRTAATLAGLALAGALLAGCSSSPSATSAAPLAATTAAPAAPVATTPAPVAITSGATLTDAQAAKLPDGVRAYTMSDGTKVATVRGQALPAPVVTDMTTKAQVTIAGGISAATVPTAERNARVAALVASLKAAGVATGRQVIAVIPVYGYRPPNGNTLTHFWTTSRMDGTYYDTAAQAQAAVEQEVAANPTGTQIVVLSN